MEAMAEFGGTSGLIQEIKAAGTNRGATISGGGLSPGTSSTSVNFTVTAAHPLVTLVSMIAPSPDWFVGVAGLSLLDSQGQTPSRANRRGSRRRPAGRRGGRR